MSTASGVSVVLEPDEVQLLNIVRQIKTKVGFGEFHGTVVNGLIIKATENYTHNFKNNLK